MISNERSLHTLAAWQQRALSDLPALIDELEAHFAAAEPEVLAFVPEDGRFDRLRRDAVSLTRLFPDPATRPPLFGVPVGVKDIYNADGFLTRAGVDLPPELFGGPEATAVTRLKQAGALILGKTVTTQFAYFAPGPTRHPLSKALGELHTPGGSSSGSAAAVAAGLSPLTLGTQTIGSINRPAAFCGVVGYKPTFDRVPKDGVVPLSPSADTMGVFVPAAADLALVAPLLVDDWSPVAAAGPARPRLAVPEGPYLERAAPAALAHFREKVQMLEARGFAVVSIPAMSDFDAIYTRHNEMVAAEAARVHEAWFAFFGDRYHPKTAELIRRGQSVELAAYERAVIGRAALRRELHGLMDEHNIDLWLSPSAVDVAPRGLESTGDPVMNLPWTHAGMPAVTLPSGADERGLPYGLQIAGRFGADEALLVAAGALAAALAPGAE